MKKKHCKFQLLNGRLGKKLIIMKLILMLTIVLGIQIKASVYSQTTLLSLKVKETPIREVLNKLEESSKFKFFYNEDFINVDMQVSLKVSDNRIDEILEKILWETDIDYQVLENNMIVLTKRHVTQDITVKGKVTDTEGNPLPGVNVVEKGTTNGAVTNLEGEYTISLSSPDAILSFSYVGFLTEEIEVAGKTQIDLTLVEDIQTLEEVVVIGYGTMKRRDLTGTISSVGTEKTRDIPNNNILQSLQGSVPGLNIETPNRPGETRRFTIRGINSISASNKPLIVVDGIIYNGALTDFNPNDIEKIDVLKDASAAAVFGARSANGVIIITTKMGETSKPMFDFNAYYGISNPTYLIPVLDGPGYIQKVLDFREASGLEADPSNVGNYINLTEAENYRNGNTVDWYDHMVRSGIVQNYNLNVSGKTDRTNYFLSGTYLSQEGIVYNDNFDRITLRANFENQITDWYKFSFRSSFSSKDYSGKESDLYYGMSPYGSYWENEELGIYKEFPMDDPYFAHPLINTLIDDKEINTSFFGVASSELDVPFIKGLKWTLNYSANLRYNKHYNFWDNTIAAGSGKTLNGRAIKELSEDHDWTLDNILNYNRTFLDIHSFDVTLLYSRSSSSFDETITEANDFFNQTLGYNNLEIAAVQKTSSELTEFDNVAYMGRLNYVFNHKYLLTATLRKDGYSGFAKGKKYALFPSLALAWTASNENFMKNISWLNLLKLRLSYGENGNQALAPYKTLARIEGEQYVYGDGGTTTTTVNVTSMANTELGWETTKVKNIGIDFGFLKNRLNGSVDVYSSNTFDLLFNRNIPATSGFNTIWTNIGKVHNQGVEVALNSKNIQNNNFSWESGFTFTLNRNRIDELLGQDLDEDGKEDDILTSGLFIGEPIDVIYGYKTDGIYQLDDTDIPSGFVPGDFRLVDITGEGEIGTDDRIILGTTNPNYSFSIFNTLKYKNFSFYVLINSIQGGGKKNYYVEDNIAMHNVNSPFSAWTERFNIQDVPYWTPNNPSNEYARINYMANRGHPYLEDRSFVRIQDVNFSYTFSKAMLGKLPLEDLRLYVSGKNLYTFTKWTGYDPENATSIGDFPMLRTFTLGIDLKF